MPLMKEEAPFKRLYYGWVIVGVTLASLALWFGIRGALRSCI